MAEAASLAFYIQVDVFTGNFGPEEQLNAITHGVGAVLARVSAASFVRTRFPARRAFRDPFQGARVLV